MDVKEIDASTKTLSQHVDDRVVRYVNEQFSMSPKNYLITVRRYWLLGAVLNIIGFAFLLLSVQSTLSENGKSSLNLVRIDGVKVQEAFDVRRSIMMKNALSREKLKQNNGSN